MNANNTLNRRCLILTLSISMPGRARKDKDVTDRTLAAEHASKEAGRFVANLYPSAAFEDAQRAATAIRALVAKRTLPWRDDGSRILPCASMLELQEELSKLREKFDLSADLSAEKFCDWLSEAAMVRNGMYKRSDYPETAADFRDGFSVRIDYLPLPDESHVVMDMAEDEIRAVRESTGRAIQEAGARAAEDLKARMAEPLRAMVATLRVPDKIFRDSLVANVREIAGAVGALNITMDPALDSLAVDMQDVAMVNPQALRDSSTVRTETAERAARILAKLNGSGAGVAA